MPGATNFHVYKPAGFLRLGTIVSVNPDLMTADVLMRDPSAGNSEKQTVQLPVSFLSPGGGFIGGLPDAGTPVVVGQGEGNQYYFVSFLARDTASKSRIQASKIKIPDILKGKITIRANDKGEINLDGEGITIGEPRNLVNFDVKRKILLNTFDSVYSLTKGSKEVLGPIKRDRNPNSKFAAFLRTADASYDDTLITIGMDPIADVTNTNENSVRNPARIEKREVIYEYDESAKIISNDLELKSYIAGSTATIADIINRREGRADALSLGLGSPNYLIESIKGTVVDLYGNILDINRNILPFDKDNSSISKVKSTADEQDDFKNVFKNIKRLERRSIAYHFEINARKDLSGAPDVSNRDDYTRLRSRFFMDVDKEGQIKLNVPASSETGNISLLTRYENFSTVTPNDKSKDPNDFKAFNDNYKDVLIEPFSKGNPNGVIDIIDELGGAAAPIDRFSSIDSPTYIKHGTAYHDILKTCYTFQSSDFIPHENVNVTNIDQVVLKKNIVNPKIKINGKDANAGGRSGNLNFDGSLEINIGANTVDRQSLWLDLQGGMVANVGRDIGNDGINNISAALNFDGEVLIQSGGSTVPNETKRFVGTNSGNMAGAVDIRVLNGNDNISIIRIDKNGVTILSAGRLTLSSVADLILRSNASIKIDAPQVLVQGREVVKDPGQNTI